MVLPERDKAMAEFFSYLRESGKWDKVEEELRAQLTDELSNVDTPEESYKVAIKVQLISSAMQLVEQQLTQ